MRRRSLIRLAGIAVLLFLIGSLDAQRGWGSSARTNQPPPQEWLPKNPDTEFAFSRMVFFSEGPKYNWYAGWTTDYPAADVHLIQGFNRLSRINAHQEPLVMPIDNPRLFQYPYIYSVEPGFLVWTDAEVARLREYLLRGGTYMADDYHGHWEWDHWVEQMKRVLPDRQIVELPIEHPIFHTVFDIPDKLQVPGAQYLRSGRMWEKDYETGHIPYYRAILDDDGRPMVLISHNMDWGDAWEWADVPEYEERFTTRAYRLEINYIVFTMTH
jgi:hypothetical protein